MFRKSIVYVLLSLALVTMACGISVDLPVRDVKTGPLQTDEITVSAPDTDVVDLTMAFGAGELTIRPGENKELISGTASYNVPDFKPKLTIEGEKVRLESGNLEVNGIPKFTDDIQNEWDLNLGSQPMYLHLNAGAYQAEIELGGLAIRSLEVSDGAADVNLRFSSPNLVEMDTLTYETGASDVQLFGLSNANFTYMVFRSGAGDYTLDFSGELQRDAIVRVESGVSKVTIIIPDGMTAVVNTSGGMLNVDTDGEWTKSGKQYRFDGTGYKLTFDISMGAGNLELRHK